MTTRRPDTDEPSLPGATTDWLGFERRDFTCAQRACIVVSPARAAPSRPWVWRARFFGHEPQTDLALLGHGFHVAYIDVTDLYGGPQAVAIWDRFYRELTEQRGLARRPALEGMSRGGLIAFNWAAENARNVACIYADAPVCDIRSWPGGKGAGNGSPEDWARCLEAYGLREDEADRFQRNPIDRLAPLARERVPVLCVCGDADESVPVAENTQVLEARYRELGGPIAVILKPGCAHHPHSLEDPAPIVEFMLAHAGNA